ncbi:MAG: type II toxin-antitoxin system death-on-curing family toxin [Candidatus Melainabacteria bacterium]
MSRQRPVIYLTLVEVLAMHQILIQRYGGHAGIREPGALESALARPQMGYYQSAPEQAAALAESLAMNHPFVDGNKRIAFAVMHAFLVINGYQLTADSAQVYRHWIRLLESGAFRYAAILSWLDGVTRPTR